MSEGFTGLNPEEAERNICEFLSYWWHHGN